MRRSAVMIITNGFGNVLLLRRSLESPNFPGEWCLPGGKVDWIPEETTIRGFGPDAKVKIARPGEWETYDSAAYRETIEETGLDASVFKKSEVIMADGAFVVHIYESLLTFEENQISVKFPNREHMEYGFFTPHNLPEDIGKKTKQILEQTIFKNY